MLLVMLLGNNVVQALFMQATTLYKRCKTADIVQSLGTRIMFRDHVK